MSKRVETSACLTLVLLWLFASPSVTFGQGTAPVEGVVVDARTRQPLAGAVVEVTSPPQSATTDAMGRFRVEAVPVGVHELLVSVVGFALARLAVDVGPEGANVTVRLTEGMAAFNETVTVHESVFAAREIGVAGQQSLASAELRQLGGMTLDDPLRAVQALSGANASDDFYGNLSVRGNPFPDLNYTVDGVPAMFLQHTLKFVEDGASVTMINGDVLDHASLLRGAYPQRFDQRLGAALEFTTSEGSRERTRHNLTASGTSASATADGPLGNSTRGSWLVSARFSYLDLFLKQVLNDSSLAFGFTDLFSTLVYDVSDRNRLQVTIIAGRSRYDKPVAQLGTPLDLGRASHAGWMATGAWRHTASPGLTLTQRAFVTGESYDNRNGLDAQVATGHGADYGYRVDLQYSSRAGQLFEAGASVERLAADEQLVFGVPGWHITGGQDFASHALKGGAYGQMQWNRGAVTVTPGARFDRFELTDDWTGSPWLQVAWQPRSTLIVSLDAGLHHQFPEFSQLVGRRGDPTLRPARAVHVDAGLEARVNETMRWQVTIYGRQERDVLDLPAQYYRRAGGVLLPRSDTSLFANNLKVSSRGVELMLQRKSPDGLSGWISYAFGHTRDTDRVTGQTFDGDFDQRHTISLFGRYRISDRMSVNARWRFGSNRPITGYIDRAPDGEFAVGSVRNATRLPAYSRLDARMDRTYAWRSRRLTLFAEVANVLNRENFRQVPPSIDARTGFVYDPLRTMFPIVPSVGATLEF